MTLSSKKMFSASCVDGENMKSINFRYDVQKKCAQCGYEFKNGVGLNFTMINCDSESEFWSSVRSDDRVTRTLVREVGKFQFYSSCGRVDNTFRVTNWFYSGSKKFDLPGKEYSSYVNIAEQIQQANIDFGSAAEVEPEVRGLME